MPLVAYPQGIPIPVEEIRSAFESVAVPGYTGTLQLDIVLRKEAAEHVEIGVIRRQSQRMEDQLATTRQVLPDPTRKKPVEKAINNLRSRLVIRCVVASVEARFLDGVLQNYLVQE